MKRTIHVTWTIADDISIDIPDGELTADEIRGKVEAAVRVAIPMGCDEHDWEWAWGDEPKAKGQDVTPPDDAWFDVDGTTIATNGMAAITRGCPLDGFVNTRTWLTTLNPSAIEYLSSVLRKDFQSMPLHQGWFHKSFQCFKHLKVVGNTCKSGDQSAYVLGESGEFLALLMPSDLSPDRDQIDSGEYFQFGT